MTWSLNEIEALAKKAARGAGLPWGLAEEASKATRWLCAAGWPGAEALAAHLTEIQQSDPHVWTPQVSEEMWTAKGGTLCPIRTGALISDLAADWAAGQTLKLGPTAQPMLLIPYLVWAADRTGAALQLSWQGFAVSRAQGETRVQTEQAGKRDISQADCISLSLSQTPAGEPIKRSYRASPSPQAIEILSSFAQKTYAPETEESRLSGAGAGLTDND